MSGKPATRSNSKLRHQKDPATMLDFLNRFWVVLPLTYAATVGGLVSGYRRGGVPENARLWRAVRASIPVMVGLTLACDIIV